MNDVIMTSLARRGRSRDADDRATRTIARDGARPLETARDRALAFARVGVACAFARTR